MDFPEEAVPLVHPARAGPAPFLLSLAFDFAKNTVLVAEPEKVFGGEEIHDLSIFKPAHPKKQGSRKAIQLQILRKKTN
jgi:hypothetical protein